MVKKERVIGFIVPWAIVAVVFALQGHAIVNVPPSFWEFFRR